MNLLILSHYDRLALDLHTNLTLHGFNSILLTTKEVEGEENVVDVSFFKSHRLTRLFNHARAFVYRKLLLWSNGYYYQDIREDRNYYSLGRIRKRIPFKPELVLILFDYRMVTAKMIQEIYKWSNARIVWLMVDMKPLTGGCAYSGNCTNYTIGCRECPLITNHFFRNFAHTTLETRKKLLMNVDLQIIAPSSYLYAQATSSSLFRDREIHKLFLPSNGRIFRSDGRVAAREILQLPVDANIILFGAQSFDSERKGYAFLLETLILLSKLCLDLNIVLLTVGNGNLPERIVRNYRIVNLGFVNYNKLALAYQAADVFLCPTIEDSGPIMVNQSLMCGTPVVAFKMGVSLDLVVDGKTGYLAELGDSKGLCDGIVKILSVPPTDRAEFNRECELMAKRLSYSAFVASLRMLLN